MEKKRKIGFSVCALLLSAALLAVGFISGLTVGVRENKSGFFARTSEKFSAFANQPCFDFVFGESQKKSELNTPFSEIEVDVGETFENAAYYFNEPKAKTEKMRLHAVSLDESIATVKIKSTDEFSVKLSVFGVSSGKTEIVLTDEGGSTLSQKICVFVKEKSSTDETTSAEEEKATEKTTADEVTQNKNAYLGQIDLKPGKRKLKLSAGQEAKTCIFSTDNEKINLEKYKLEAVCSDEDIANVQIESVGKKSVRVSITGKAPGKTLVSINAESGDITAEELCVVVSDAPVSTTAEQTAAETQTEKEKEDSSTVFKTPSGSCYHRKGCRYAGSNASALTVEQAKESGLRPCKVCKP